jgi:hypothetical protein
MRSDYEPGLPYQENSDSSEQNWLAANNIRQLKVIISQRDIENGVYEHTLP